MFRLPNRVHRYCANTFVRTILIYQNAAMTSCLQIRKGKVDSQRCFLRASKIYPQSKYCSGFIFPQITPHCLRHSKAMHLVEAGKNLIYIRDFLGHESIETTQVYAKANPEARRKALETMDTRMNTPAMPDWNDDPDLKAFLKTL